MKMRIVGIGGCGAGDVGCRGAELQNARIQSWEHGLQECRTVGLQGHGDEETEMWGCRVGMWGYGAKDVGMWENGAGDARIGSYEAGDVGCKRVSLQGARCRSMELRKQGCGKYRAGDARM